MKVGEVEDALAAATDKEPSAKVKDTLLALYPKLAPALAPALQARTEDRTAGLQKKLAERADKEADDIRAILTELKRAIEEELDQPEAVQLTLFDDAGAGSVRAEQAGAPESVEGNPGGNRAGDGGGQGEVRRPATPDVPGGGDVPGAGKTGA